MRLLYRKEKEMDSQEWSDSIAGDIRCSGSNEYFELFFIQNFNESGNAMEENT